MNLTEILWIPLEVIIVGFSLIGGVLWLGGYLLKRDQRRKLIQHRHLHES